MATRSTGGTGSRGGSGTKNAKKRGARRTSRSEARAHLLEAARQVEVPARCDVCVVGGGASGLVAAIVAAEAGAQTLVLERAPEPGRTILATGNGRCNFGTMQLSPSHYNQPAFVEAAASANWTDEVLAFFRASGLFWDLEDDRLYPASRQAASVRNVLLARARRAGVTFACAREVTEVSPGADGLAVRYASEDPALAGTTRARAVVLAVGGGATQELACQLGLACVPQTPVLCPLACEDSPLLTLDGRRAHVAAQLYRDGMALFRERGEALIRSYGLSGIVSFDLSRRAQPGDLVTLDLLPDYRPSDIRQLVDPWAHGGFEPGAFDGMVDPQIARVVEELARRRWQLPGDDRLNAPDPAASDTEYAIALLKGLPFRVTGLAHPELAQVTRGGIAVGQLDPTSLAVAALPGLFACGEALDVDADCGGFNLSWAWKSGLVAGASAAAFAGEKPAAPAPFSPTANAPTPEESR